MGEIILVRIPHPHPSRCLFFNKKQLLGLVKVRDVPLVVDAPPEVPCTCAVAGAAADEAELDAVAVDVDLAEVERWVSG